MRGFSAPESILDANSKHMALLPVASLVLCVILARETAVLLCVTLAHETAVLLCVTLAHETAVLLCVTLAHETAVLLCVTIARETAVLLFQKPIEPRMTSLPSRDMSIGAWIFCVSAS
jgi:hypothetical protein